MNIAKNGENMLYRTLGKTGEKVSVLGYGCMRLPVIGNNYGKVDEKRP